MRLTPGPCASLPTDLTEDPLVARIVPTKYNGHAIMYTDNKVMTVQERNSLINTSLPDLELQPGIPDSFISVKLPRTNIDHEDILVHRRVAIKQGGTLTLGGAYLWDLVLLLEGLSAESEAPVNWQNQSDVVVRMSKRFLFFKKKLRHSAEVRYDSEGFVRLSELMSASHSIVNSLLTPSTLLAAILGQSKTTFSSVFANLPREWYHPQAVCYARHWSSSGSGTLNPR